MPAPKLLASLPKPVLFGLYGAIGGLIGALAFGEPVWRLLKPPPVEQVAQLGVSASASVQVYPAATNTFVVQIARERFDGPLAVKFTGTPSTATIEPITFAPGQTQATATVSTSPIAAPGPSRITATAEGGGATATTSFDLLIAPAPPPPARLAISVAPNLLVYKRGTCQFTIQVARAGFDDKVFVTFDSLPPGVEVAPVVIDRGKTEAEVTLRTTDAAAFGTTKLTATAEANSLRSEVQTELVVVNPPPRPADIMFVLDCSGSMEPFIDGVKDGIRDFVNELNSKQIDGRVGLLAYRDRLFGQEPELLTFEKDSPFTTNTKLFSEKVGKLRCIGNNTVPESTLDGTMEAAKQPFRQSAARVLLLITDAPPLIPDKTTQTMKEAVDGLKEKQIDLLHVVVRRADRRIYESLQEGASGKGKFFDLERVTSGGEKFATILPELSREIANTVAAKPLKAEVAPAPPPPAIPAAQAAQPLAADAPPVPTVKSLQSNEQAAAGSEGRLVLRSGLWAGAIAALVCLALLAGQHHYLRGSLPPTGGTVAGLLGGLAVGVVGGAAGQGLFLLAQQSEALGVAFRILGWAILGGLAGVGLSLFIPNMKWVYGLAGGALGGALGAAGFLAVAAVTNDLAGRLIGGLLLGLCIGLMVAVVEAAFRRAWLEVRFGARETIAVNLGPEPVKVGGDSRMCTVWARGAAPLALRYFIRNGQVICDDAVMKRETVVGEGYAKEVGNVTVTVRTSSTATTVAVASLRPAAAPTPVKPAPLNQDADVHQLPLPIAVRPAAPAPAPSLKPTGFPNPAKPTIAGAASQVASKPAPSAPARSVAKHPDGCPTCGRANAGSPGSRYCVVCDQTY